MSFKSILATPVILLLALTRLSAASISVERGINFDLWSIWPDEAEWSREEVLLPYPEWRRTINREDLVLLKETGFDFIRIPVDPLPFLSPKATALREGLFESVLEGVRFINSAGLKAIVDMHPIPRGADRFAGNEELLRDAALFDRYLDLIRRMGRTLAGEDPEQVAFELMNEPVIGCEGDDGRIWNDKLARLFAAARASAPRLTLVLSGACWGSAEGLAAIDPKSIPDDNVIWSFHSYAPFILTTQGALWAGDFIRYVTGIPYPPYGDTEQLEKAVETARQRIRAEAPLMRRAGMLAYLDEQVALVNTQEKLEKELATPFRTVARWAVENGIDPRNVILGEFGMIRQEYGSSAIMEPQWRAAYVQDMAELAKAHDFAWSIWGYGGAFGVVEAFGGERAEPNVLKAVRNLGTHD